MKKYIVRLSEAARKTRQEAIEKLKSSSQKARRARILLQINADGPDRCACQVAEAYGGRDRTVANVRKRYVLEGFELALDRRQRDPSTWPPKRLDGRQEAARIGLRLVSPTGRLRTMVAVPASPRGSRVLHP